MEYSVFKVKLNSRYSLVLMTIFDVIAQVIGWINYDKKLFYYKECSFDMKGNSKCNGNTYENQCFAETHQQCDTAFSIVQIYLQAIIYPVAFQIYSFLVFLIQICCCCKRQNYGLLKFNLFMKLLIQFICAALFFYTSSYLIELSKSNLNLNGQITKSCIALGILCFLSGLCQLYMNYELYYLKEIARIIKAQENNFEEHRTSTEPVDHNKIQIQQYGQVPNNYRQRQN